MHFDWLKVIVDVASYKLPVIIVCFSVCRRPHIQTARETSCVTITLASGLLSPLVLRYELGCYADRTLSNLSWGKRQWPVVLAVCIDLARAMSMDSASEQPQPAASPPSSEDASE